MENNTEETSVEDIPALEEQDQPTDAEATTNKDDLAEEETITIQPTEKGGVKQTIEVPFSSNTANSSTDTIDLPADFGEAIKESLSNLPNINLVDSEDVRKWTESVESALSKETFKEVYKKALQDTTRDFRQFVEYGGKKLAGAQPRLKESEGQTYKGERGMIRLMSYLGRGVTFQIPLWHSGIWVTFKAPGESEILELNRQLLADKIQYGRYTYGAALSNSIAYTTNRLVDFAIGCIYNTTLKLDEGTELTFKDILLSQDIPSLLWGLACSIYPNGFRYRRACINDAEKCNYILEETLNVSKLLWADNNALTEWQKTHMSDRQANCKKIDSINRYKEELQRATTKSVKLTSDAGKELTFVLSSPTITQYVDSGYKWIDEITNMIENSIVEPTNIDEKNNFIRIHAQATTMRQYSHWVKEIEFADDNIMDKETIEKLFNNLSTDNRIRNDFLEAIINYINESSVAVVGIPVFTCPQCDSEQKAEENIPYSKQVIPLDVYQVFTDLILERLQKIMER
jgi:hypothetical protein